MANAHLGYPRISNALPQYKYPVRSSIDMVDHPPGNGTAMPAANFPSNQVPITTGDMHAERNRLDSFRHPNWNCFMDPKKLARSGFYYFGKDDHVRCAFCKVEIGRWVPGDDCDIDHQRWGPMCPFLRGFEVGNIALDPTSVPPRRSQDICGRIGIEIRPNTVPEDFGPSIQGNVDLKNLGVNPHNGPVHSMYCTEASRIATFKEWPRMMKQKPKELAEAGFFYTGRGDQTTCFHCGLGLKDWEENDVPWEQHARWYSKCTHVLLNKGQEFIQQILTKQPPVLGRDDALELVRNSSGENSRKESSCESVSKSLSPEPQPEVAAPVSSPPTGGSSEASSSQGDEGCLCQICYLERWNVLFLPCKHALACKKCAPLLTSCPLCREQITATLRIYPSCNHDHRDTS